MSNFDAGHPDYSSDFSTHMQRGSLRAIDASTVMTKQLYEIVWSEESVMFGKFSTLEDLLQICCEEKPCSIDT